MITDNRPFLNIALYMGRNVFELLGAMQKTLQANGQADKYKEFKARIDSEHCDYDGVFELAEEFVR